MYSYIMITHESRFRYLVKKNLIFKEEPYTKSFLSNIPMGQLKIEMISLSIYNYKP